VEGSGPGITKVMSDGLLAIYLNDHYAGATAGSGLAARLAGANRGDERFGPALDRLATEIREDRETLKALMGRLDVGIDRAKQLGAWAAEKVGRLKLNGRLLSYSPLSRVEELEALRLGVTGKHLLWLTLRSLAAEEPRLAASELNRLIKRAERQLELIGECHQRATAEAF
jgi:hypothetical protein